MTIALRRVWNISWILSLLYFYVKIWSLELYDGSDVVKKKNEIIRASTIINTQMKGVFLLEGNSMRRQ